MRLGCSLRACTAQGPPAARFGCSSASLSSRAQPALPGRRS
jgi:hypothetical protein